MAGERLGEAVRLLAAQQTNGTYPATFMFATVKSVNPTSIQIDQKLVDSTFVVVEQHITNYTVQMSIPEVGTVNVNINNALKVGDKVIVSRQQGGQKYVIHDRIGG